MALKKGRRRLEEITEIPQPPAEDVERAKAEGATIVAWDPADLEKFILGEITLGELEGIPKSAQYEYAEIGYRFLQQGDKDKAFKIFSGLVALDPYDAYFHTALGVIAQQREAWEDAKRHYDRALEIYPGSPVARANRGEVLLRLGQLAPAAEDLVLAVQADPKGQYESTRRARALARAVREQLEKGGR
jgi:predicted Zn-dependent protease